jgi:hypothetical protein
MQEVINNKENEFVRMLWTHSLKEATVVMSFFKRKCLKHFSILALV